MSSSGALPVAMLIKALRRKRRFSSWFVPAAMSVALTKADMKTSFSRSSSNLNSGFSACSFAKDESSPCHHLFELPEKNRLTAKGSISETNLPVAEPTIAASGAGMPACVPRVVIAGATTAAKVARPALSATFRTVAALSDFLTSSDTVLIAPGISREW